jgi:ABC-type transport system involved in multi-copper enzyme maturation permease subunit
LVLGIIILVVGYYKFNFNVVKSKTSKKKIQSTKETKTVSEQNYKTPKFSLHYDFKAQFIQLKVHSLFYFKSILKQTSFWAIVICGMIIILINSVNLGTVYDVDSYLATYFIVEELQETSMYFFIIILVFYSGELIWKERSAKLNLIYDATPMSDFVNLAGKFIGLLLIYVVLMLSLIVSGIIFQTISGYYQYEFDV